MYIYSKIRIFKQALMWYADNGDVALRNPAARCWAPLRRQCACPLAQQPLMSHHVDHMDFLEDNLADPNNWTQDMDA